MMLFNFPLTKRLINVAIAFSFLQFGVPALAAEPQIIGFWDNSRSRENYKVIIAVEGDVTILVKRFEDGIIIRQVLTESQGVNGIVYNQKDATAEEYYILDRSGNLQVWGVSGMKTTIKAKK